MALTNATIRKAERYAKISEGILETSSWVRSVARTDHEGMGAAAESVKFYVHGNSAISAYTRGSGIAGALPQADDTTPTSNYYVTLSNFVEEGINEIIDGFDAASAPEDYVLRRLEAAVLGLGKNQDKEMIDEIATNGTGVVTGALSKSNIYEKVLLLKETLDSAKAPQTDRYLIVSPANYNFLLQDSNFLLASEASMNIKFSGQVLMGAGFIVIMEPELASHTTITEDMIAVQKRGLGHADEFKVAPTVVDLMGSASFIGDSALKARNIYTQGVIRPEIVLYATTA